MWKYHQFSAVKKKNDVLWNHWNIKNWGFSSYSLCTFPRPCTLLAVLTCVTLVLQIQVLQRRIRAPLTGIWPRGATLTPQRWRLLLHSSSVQSSTLQCEPKPPVLNHHRNPARGTAVRLRHSGGAAPHRFPRRYHRSRLLVCSFLGFKRNFSELASWVRF